jgi:1-Cys peroxiredoxin 6
MLIHFHFYLNASIFSCFVVNHYQLTAKYKVATPVNWVQGGACMLTPGVKEEEYKNFPKGVTIADVPSGKPYLRETPQPDH